MNNQASSAAAANSEREDIMRWLALWGLSIPIYATITLSPIMNGAAMDHLGLDTFEIGKIRTLEVLTNALVTIGLAPRLAKFDSKRLGLLGAVIMAIAAAASAAAPHAAALFAARLGAGLGAGLTQCALSILVAETRSPQKTGGSLMIPVTASAVAIALIGGRLAQSHGQAGVFLCLAGACLVGLALGCASPPSPAVKHALVSSQSPTTSLGALRSSYVLGSAILFLGSSAYWAFFERKGKSLGLAAPDISNLIAIAALSAGVFASASLFVRDRGVRTAAIAAVASFAVCASIGPLATGPLVFSAAYIVQTIAYAISQNLLTAFGVQLDPTGRLAAAGRGWSTLVNATAPALGGALIIWGGFAPLSLLCLIAGALSVFFLVRSKKINP